MQLPVCVLIDADMNANCLHVDGQEASYIKTPCGLASASMMAWTEITYVKIPN